MQIKIRTDNMELTEEIKELIDSKLSQDLDVQLEDFAEDIKDAKVNIEKLTRWGFKISFDMWLPGKKHIYAEEKGEKIPVIIAEIQEKLEEQIRDYIERLQDKRDQKS